VIFGVRKYLLMIVPMLIHRWRAVELSAPHPALWTLILARRGILTSLVPAGHLDPAILAALPRDCPDRAPLEAGPAESRRAPSCLAVCPQPAGSGRADAGRQEPVVRRAATGLPSVGRRRLAARRRLPCCPPPAVVLPAAGRGFARRWSQSAAVLPAACRGLARRWSQSAVALPAAGRSLLRVLPAACRGLASRHHANRWPREHRPPLVLRSIFRLCKFDYVPASQKLHNRENLQKSSVGMASVTLYMAFVASQGPRVHHQAGAGAAPSFMPASASPAREREASEHEGVSGQVWCGAAAKWCLTAVRRLNLTGRLEAAVAQRFGR
jgi:hypothetical protein